MVNPMRNNWWEMINFVKFADTHQCNLWFNTILYPKEHALHNLPPAELKNIYDKLSKKLDEYSRTRDNYGPKHNLHVGEHLVHNQIKNWLLDSYVI